MCVRAGMSCSIKNSKLTLHYFWFPLLLSSNSLRLNSCNDLICFKIHTCKIPLGVLICILSYNDSCFKHLVAWYQYDSHHVDSWKITKMSFTWMHFLLNVYKTFFCIIIILSPVFQNVRRIILSIYIPFQTLNLKERSLLSTGRYILPLHHTNLDLCCFFPYDRWSIRPRQNPFWINLFSSPERNFRIYAFHTFPVLAIHNRPL